MHSISSHYRKPIWRKNNRRKATCKNETKMYLSSSINSINDFAFKNTNFECV